MVVLLEERLGSGNRDVVVFDAATAHYQDFLSAASSYLAGAPEEPVIRAVSQHSNVGSVDVHFERELLLGMVERPHDFRKYFNSLRHGYIGRSRGGRNGIVSVDKGRHNHLVTKVESFLASARGQDLMRRRGITAAEPVKVVAHEMNGDRLVGILDRVSRSVFLYGVENYSH